MIATVIIDDEPRSRKAIRAILESNCPDINIVGEASSVKDGEEIINTLQPDLLFLDIRMQDGTGFNLLAKFENIKFKIVFVTGYEEYALKAIKLCALDYILKPINPIELIASVERFKQSETNVIFSRKDVSSVISLFRHMSDRPQRISIRTFDSVWYVNVDEIIRLQSERNYTRFYFTNGKTQLVSKTLGDFETMLDGFGFIRVQQSHIINIQHVVRYVKGDGGYLVMCDDSSIPISQKLKDTVLGILDFS